LSIETHVFHNILSCNVDIKFAAYSTCTILCLPDFYYLYDQIFCASDYINCLWLLRNIAPYLQVLGYKAVKSSSYPTTARSLLCINSEASFDGCWHCR